MNSSMNEIKNIEKFNAKKNCTKNTIKEFILEGLAKMKNIYRMYIGKEIL